jgi:hypothetical protein
VLAVIGIVYGALVALAQTDFKFVIGYSSVSHMGFVLLGLMTLNQIGVTGAVLQMFSHGIIAGLLFAIVGRIVYDRTHTRQLAELGDDAPLEAIALCRVGVCDCRNGFDGAAGLLRICGRVAGAGRRVDGQAVVGGARAWALWWAWLTRGARCRRLSSAMRCPARTCWSRSTAHHLPRSPGLKLPAWCCWRE